MAADRLGARLIEGGLPTFSLTSGETLSKKLLMALSISRPDVVLTHWNHDSHNDHRVLGQASLHCCRREAGLLMYQSNWYASDACFDPRLFVDIGEQLEEKIALVRMHASEFGRTSGRWEEALRATARDRGERAGCKHAEGYQVVRWRLQ